MEDFRMNKITSKGIIGKFYHKLSQLTGASWIDATSMYFGDSNQEIETYAWLGMSPQMREWVGGRNAKALKENAMTIRNKPFEATLEISVNDIRRDKTSQIDMRIGELAKRAVSHWATLLTPLIYGGLSGVCYDGQYFFDNDHSEGDSGTQKNLLTASEVTALNISTATAPTATEMVDAIMGVIAYMLGIKDDQGEPMNEDAREFLVMVGTAPMWTALCAALGNPLIISSGAAITNVLSTLDGFKIRGEYNPRLSAYTDDMVIFRTDSDVKALIRQEETPISMKAIAEGSELEFNNNVHHYGVDASRNVGYGFWQMASWSTFS
jgi:phage major head subunit gpT-like protein